ncbi:MAG: ATP-binding cassette domain-containing protein [Myxococcota bacterium]
MADALVVDGICVRLGDHVLLDDVSYAVARGEVVGLVGSSGSGKTLACRAALGMVDLAPGVVAGTVTVSDGARTHSPYDGLHGRGRRARDRAFRVLRGAVVGYAPQDAVGALDPFARVGAQVRGAARLAGRDADPVPWLLRAGFARPDAVRVAGCWPHQLSGGMAQRVVMAQSLARGSRFLLADEPTTGLDAPLQLQVVAELRGLADREGLGVVLVTHDLRMVRRFADRVVVMDRARVVETLTAAELAAGAAASDAGQALFAAALGAA